METVSVGLPIRLWRWLKCWGVRNFSGSGPALAVLAALVFGAVAGYSLAATYWPDAGGYLLLPLGAALLALGGSCLISRLLRRLLGRSFGCLLSLALLTGSVGYTVEQAAGEGWSWRVLLFSAAASVLLALFAVSWHAILGRRCRTATVISLGAISLVGVAALGAFLFTDGFDNHYIHRYLALSDHRDARRVSLDPSLSCGPWESAVITYGPEEELAAPTIDLTRYMSRDDEDLTDRYVQAYWDYTLDAVPMVGRVWYPAGGADCPVLFIAHGNHTIATESYLGYDYLGEYLASHGYVVVSVDQNACNMLSGENDGRAVLLLEHIRLCLEYSSTPGNPLYGVLDESNIAVAGHSRGGEMVATAYLFNGYDRYPENGAVLFDYGFSIRSVIAIAPTVNQYKPADHSVQLEDVNYLLLHGAADRDVTRFMGMTQYENICFTGERPALKSALYIAGANHGQFNSLWGEYDRAGAFTALFNPESLISAADQQQIARVFIKVFLDVTLRDDLSNIGLLTDWDDYAAQLPETVYAQCYETSRFLPLADFEEDSDLETGTMEGVSLSAVSPSLVWTEELMNFADGSSYDTHALRLRWTGDLTYRVTVPPMDVTGSSVVFDICDLDEDSVDQGQYELVDGLVVLEDIRGVRATARIRDFATVYPILPVRTDKLDFLFDTCTYKKAFSTVSIPVTAFTPEQEVPDWTSIRSLQLSFDSSGEVAVDNIGLETPMEYTETN